MTILLITFLSALSICAKSQCLLRSDAACTSFSVKLGRHNTPELCAWAAVYEAQCDDIFMFSYSYPAWGCNCCSHELEGGMSHSNWNLFSIEGCGATKVPSPAPTNQPTDPTSMPSSSPTLPPTARPTLQPTATPSLDPTTGYPTENPTNRPTAGEFEVAGSTAYTNGSGTVADVANQGTSPGVDQINDWLILAVAVSGGLWLILLCAVCACVFRRHRTKALSLRVQHNLSIEVTKTQRAGGELVIATSLSSVASAPGEPGAPETPAMRPTDSEVLYKESVGGGPNVTSTANGSADDPLSIEAVAQQPSAPAANSETLGNTKGVV